MFQKQVCWLQLQSLIERSSIVLTCKDAFGVNEAKLDEALEKRPELIVIDVTSFGNEGPWANYVSSDLVDGALGGANFFANCPSSPGAPCIALKITSKCTVLPSISKVKFSRLRK